MSDLKLKASDISKAFNNKKRHLLAVESGCSCAGSTKQLVVVNQAVVLRQMLEQLGYSNEEIDRCLHDV